MTDGYDRIAAAVHGAIGTQTRQVMARVVGVLLANGTLPCYSEAAGNVNVICRTTDDLSVGDWVYINRLAPEKHAPWLYAGFASSVDQTSQPKISANTTIKVPAPKDGSGATSPATTLTDTLDLMASHLRQIQGTGSWRDTPPNSLAKLITWHLPVATASDLPLIGNTLGDVRVVIDSGTIYVWGSSGWRSPAGGSVSPSAASTALITLGDHSIGSFTMLAALATGGVIASATNSDHIGHVIGMTVESAGAGQDVLVQLSGEVALDSRPAAQGPVFLGANGSLASGLVTGARFAQPLGVVLGSRLMLSLDQLVIVLEEPHIPGVTEGGVITGLDAAVDARMAAWGYATTVGDNISTTIMVAHGLGTVDVQIAVRYLEREMAYPDEHVVDVNTISLFFTHPPPMNSCRVTVRRVL